jgi:hypothetical protein
MTIKKGNLVKDSRTEIQYYGSDGISELILINDLREIFFAITNEFHTKTGEVLIFIDGTNGNLVVYPFETQKSETVEDHFVMVELTEFWEDTQNGYEFDEIMSSSIKAALNTSTSGFLQKFIVFLQTEIDQPERLTKKTTNH